MAFRPTPGERERLVAGDDLYVALLTFGHPQQPIRVLAGKEEAAAIFGIRAITINAEPDPNPLLAVQPNSNAATKTAPAKAPTES